MQSKSNQPLPHIGLDIMGCTSSPDTLLHALFELLKIGDTPSCTLTVFCTHDVLESCEAVPAPLDVCFVPCEDAIAMKDDPLSVLRKKKASTMYVALEQLAAHTLDAIITCGNTGALIAGATHMLTLLPSIKRPALIALLPTKKEPVAVLDVGANVTCDASMLVQFALMGRAYQHARGIPEPTIGILNIGEEETKGRKEFREAYTLLEKAKDTLSFTGNIEGREAFDGTVDVLITDGFTGNIFLKTAEGVSSLILSLLGDVIESDASALAPIERTTNYAEYPGALLCGLDKLVFKCHGTSDALAVKNTLVHACQLIEHHFLDAAAKQITP